jgi:dipeptidyl aminopeptidase/acylaminoacyl peptidase
MSKRPMTAEDLLKFQFIGDAQFNKDGSRILFSKRHVGEKNKYITNLWTIGPNGETPTQFTSGESDGAGRWSPDGSQIAFISGRDKPQPQIFLIPSGGGEAQKLTSFEEGSIGGFLWSPDGTKMIVSYRETHPDRTNKANKEREEMGGSDVPWEIDNLWYRLDGDGYFGPQRFKLYLLDVASGEHKPLYEGCPLGGYSYDWLPDSSGIVVIRSANENPILDKPNDQLYHVDLEGKETAIPCDLGGSKSSVKVSPDGTQLAWIGNKEPEGWGTKNNELHVMPIGGGTATNLTENDDYCLDVMTLSDTNMGHTSDGGRGGFVVWSPEGDYIYVSVGTRGEVQVGRVDSAKGGVELLSSGKHAFSAASICGCGSWFAGTIGDAEHLNEIACLSTKGGEVEKLSTFNDELFEEIYVAPSEDFEVTAKDGTKVHAWVMKPADFDPAKAHKAILEIHGGPHTQYGWGLFHEFQLLVAQGHVVVFSNPRGSKGYGEDFCGAIKGDWGVKDWEDMQAVIGWMKDQPFIDSDKMGVMGGSYGGYMTNWVIGHCNDFAGAITDRCVSNWVSMAGNSDFPMNRDAYFGGYAWGGLDKIEALWRQSPLAYFDQVTTPTLVIHSEGDLRCNVEQSDQVFHALQAQGIDSRYVRYPVSTSHGLSRGGPPDLRLHRLGEIVSWWSKYLG